jgi:yeast amino acid transporter
VAVSNAINFVYDDGRTRLVWQVGTEVDNAVWISVFLILVILFNMVPVRVFGELEYIFGCFKLMFITMLITLMFFLSIVQRKHSPELWLL